MAPLQTIVAAALAAGLVAQNPTFRSGVDLILVDTVVLDANGNPLTDLRAADFEVSVARKPRAVVSAEYIPAPPRAVVTPRSEASASSNERPPDGRTFVIVADTDSITAGSMGFAMDRIGAFVERLAANDLVAVGVLPGGKPQVDLTTDHARVRAALTHISGSMHREMQPEMSPGEATAIAAGDRRAVDDYMARIGADIADPSQACRTAMGGTPLSSGGATRFAPTSAAADISGCTQAADQMLDRYRRHTRNVLKSLGAVADALAPLSGVKTIVFVSEGLMTDHLTMDAVRDFSRHADDARVSVYAIQLSTPATEASARGGPTAAMRALDAETGFDGLSAATGAARGAVLRVVGTADRALDRLDRETSGYYLLAIERDPSDRDDARVDLSVRARRPGADVRYRTSVTPRPLRPAAPGRVNLNATAADLKLDVGNLLRSPVMLSDVPIAATAYARLPSGGAKRSLVLVAELDGGSDAGPPAALGFEVLDDGGKVVADKFDPAPATTESGSRRIYAASMTLPPGAFTARLAVVDPSGRAGTVSHGFTVGAPSKPVVLGDVILGDESSGAFVPTARVPARFAAIVDIGLTRAGDARGLGAVAILSHGRNELGRSVLTIREIADPLRRQAKASFDLSTLSEGDYSVTVELSRNGAVVATSSREFRVTGRVP